MLSKRFAAALLWVMPIAASAAPGNGAGLAGSAAQGDNAAGRVQFRITRVSPAYWRVSIDHPPFNIFGPESIPQLEEVIRAIEQDPQLKVVVFASNVPGFFLTHYDFTPPLARTTSIPSGRTGLPALTDILVRLSKAPVVSIVEIRGRASGVGSELSLASDMRFASRENARLSQFEVGAGFVPGGGPMARLPRLVGRGRALEILLGGDDISGDLAERYGYVNRALPDTELDGFIDNLARRIASYDRTVIGEIKALVNRSTLPADQDLAAEWSSFIGSVQRPAAQERIELLMKLGLQTRPEVEVDLPQYTGQASRDVEQRAARK
ncbi:enoyl-CoA hydratase/isomerase family protein [Sphingomonas quercus]|uniref:Enoyl-CoA hydratase/isomerase family protein n=1 Tax=Sphingomonas quercus TaxID=2842451 RepID=A0ABS6BM21_9SPHN|nr:enoyl-CoA hydratase/isomerase family protein [Sphingomonas quercus]MBU3078821.1 enoyl-CoA hydratase/isomerase family protein [Sphingomonas quercus]